MQQGCTQGRKYYTKTLGINRFVAQMPAIVTIRAFVQQSCTARTVRCTMYVRTKIHSHCFSCMLCIEEEICKLLHCIEFPLSGRTFVPTHLTNILLIINIFYYLFSLIYKEEMVGVVINFIFRNEMWGEETTRKRRVAWNNQLVDQILSNRPDYSILRPIIILTWYFGFVNFTIFLNYQAKERLQGLLWALQSSHYIAIRRTRPFYQLLGLPNSPELFFTQKR